MKVFFAALLMRRVKLQNRHAFVMESSFHARILGLLTKKVISIEVFMQFLPTSHIKPRSPKNFFFLLSLFFTPAWASAVCDGPKGLSGFFRPTVSTATAAVGSFGAAQGSGASMTWSRLNQVAATEAAPQGSTAYDEVMRSAWGVGQSRLRYCHELPDDWSATTELDFVDFDKAAATVAIRPRLRVLGASKIFNGKHQVFFGQDWDIMAAEKPFTFDYVSLYFRAGNVGFMRPQTRYTYLKDGVEKFAIMAGASGVNDGSSSDSAVERTVMPTVGARYFFFKDKEWDFGVAGRALYRRFEDSPRNQDINRWSYVASTFARWASSSRFETKANLYYGANIESSGSSLTLSTGSYTGDQYELGGFLTQKWNFQDPFYLQWGVGFAQLVGAWEKREGTLNANNVERVALGWTITDKVEGFAEATLFHTSYTWKSLGSNYSNAFQTEIGLVVRL